MLKIKLLYYILCLYHRVMPIKWPWGHTFFFKPYYWFTCKWWGHRWRRGNGGWHSSRGDFAYKWLRQRARKLVQYSRIIPGQTEARPPAYEVGHEEYGVDDKTIHPGPIRDDVIKGSSNEVLVIHKKSSRVI